MNIDEQAKEYFFQLALLCELKPHDENAIDNKFIKEHFDDITATSGLNPEPAYARQLKEYIEKHPPVDIDQRIFSTQISADVYNLKSTALEIEDAIKRRGIILPSKPYFGILNTGFVNGQAIRIPNTKEYIIALHSGTLDLFSNMADLISYILPAVTEDGGFEFLCDIEDEELINKWKFEINKKPEAVEQLILIVMSYLNPIKDTSKKLKKLINQDNGRFHVSSNLSAGSRLFLIGHEYGHIVANHLTLANESTKIMNNKITNISLVQQNWDKEFEADSYGGNFSIGAMLHAIKQLEICVVAIDNFFTILHLLEMCRDISAGKYLSIEDSDYKEPGWADTHPPIALRRDKIFDHLRATFGEDLKSSEEVCRYFRFATRCLFELAQPKLMQELHGMFLSLIGVDKDRAIQLLYLLGNNTLQVK